MIEMKLHRSLAEAVVQSLHAIFSENKYADKVIEKVLKQNPKWGARDRRFIAETSYDIVRWRRFYQVVTSSSDHDYWKWLAAWLAQHNFEMPAWKEFNQIAFAEVSSNLRNKCARPIEQSIPDWLDNLGLQQLGDKWAKELAALNEQAKVVLRVNTVKTSKVELASLLKADGMETETLANFPDALVLLKRQNIFQSPYFKNGLFEVMDAGSQSIAEFLIDTQARGGSPFGPACHPPAGRAGTGGGKGVGRGLRVIDACAGAGGKTLHLSALLKNKGKIISLDTEHWKLDELSKRARRAGAFNIETRVIDSGKVIKRLENSADYILLDVPCSGLGVLKRNPDAKWKLSLDFIQRVNVLQKQILQDYSTMLKPTGILVYSTCSILPMENQEVVIDFIQRNPDFVLDEEKHQWPSEGFDGFYMARFFKKQR